MTSRFFPQFFFLVSTRFYNRLNAPPFGPQRTRASDDKELSNEAEAN